MITMNEDLFLFGGSAYSSETGWQMDPAHEFISQLLNDLQLFDTTTFQWRNLNFSHGTPPTPRAGHGLAGADGKIYVFGGYGSRNMRENGYQSAYLNDLHRLDTMTMEWTSIIPDRLTGAPPSRRAGFGFAALKDKLFVFGGYSQYWMYTLPSVDIFEGELITFERPGDLTYRALNLAYTSRLSQRHARV